MSSLPEADKQKIAANLDKPEDEFFAHSQKLFFLDQCSTLVLLRGA